MLKSVLFALIVLFCSAAQADFYYYYTPAHSPVVRYSRVPTRILTAQPRSVIVHPVYTTIPSNTFFRQPRVIRHCVNGQCFTK